MRHHIHRLLIPAAGIFMLLGAACANIGNPSGGPRDEDPPIMISANPPAGATNVTREKITLNFNEIVNVQDAFSRVVVSPPSKSVPRVTALGRRVTVDFDSLAPNTTYTIDFADAIEDNNEGNALQGFTYTFSTGPDIDTLRISGRVLNARDLEPRQGILVGVHPADNDTAFTTQRFLRVAKTDDRGRFTIRGLKEGNYNVFALDDKDNDGAYANPEEDLGFYPVSVTPHAERTTALDSVYNPRTGLLDTVVERGRTRFLPNDIIIRTFNTGVRSQYLDKYERPDSGRIYLKFNAPASSLPEISVVDHPYSGQIGVVEGTEKKDSLVYWLAPELASIDSLRLAVKYLRTDSTGSLTSHIDTLRFFHRRMPAKKASKKEKQLKISVEDSLAKIAFKFNVQGGTQAIGKPFAIEVPAPLASLDTPAFRLLSTQDSVWNPVPLPLSISRPDSLAVRKLVLEYPWEFATKYRLEADTLAARDIYGKVSRPLKVEFQTKAAEDYCSLSLNLTNLPDSTAAFVELLSSNDGVIASGPVAGGRVNFNYLEPGRFYARLIIDRNGNGEFDPGSYELGLQPDLAYYYPKAINIKKNWSREETWDPFATPTDMQKPSAILKNKPKTTKGRTSEEEPEEEEEIFDPTRNPFDPNYRRPTR